jgi:nucleoside phosphorylase
MKDLILTALSCEAIPIFEHFGLNQNRAYSYPVYTNEKLVLIISGIGQDKAYEAAKFAFSKFRINHAYNIGICGCKDEDVFEGTLFGISKVIDTVDKDFEFEFSKIFGVTEAITTAHKPIDDPADLETSLVDMELSGFVKACKEVLPDNRIHAYKVVSDHLDTKIPSKKFVSEIIRQNIINMNFV